MKTNWPCESLLRFALLFSVLSAGAEATQPPSGVVRLDGRAFTDANGPFLGLGVTYMQALRHCKYEREKLESNLAFLSSRGFHFVRILTMVAWPGQEIAPVELRNFDDQQVGAWPDYWEQFDALIDLVHAHGMRTEITVFADAQRILPDREGRIHHLEKVLDRIAGREEKVMFVEVANEAWQNGFPGEEGIADLRDFGRRIAERTDLLVALSSPSDLFDRGAELRALHEGSAADLAMVHFSRNVRSEIGGWLPVIDPWNYRGMLNIPVLSNEPIGPGASVNTETDPVKLVAAAAYAYLAGLPGYVFHTGAGTYARVPFEEMPAVNEFQNLIGLLPNDLPNWTPDDGEGDSSPFIVDAGEVVRICGAKRGTRFVAMPIGVGAEGVRLTTRRAAVVKISDPLSGEVHQERELSALDALDIPVGGGAWWIEGEWTQEEAPSLKN